MHVEVQFEACELIKDLMKYDIREDLMQRLVTLLRPTAADIEKVPEVSSGMCKYEVYFFHIFDSFLS